MSTKSISNATKDRLKEAVNDMVILVDEGHHPTSALTKVAKELNLTEDQTRLVGRAFNTSATTEVREKGATILEKLATVPIADCEEAVAKLTKTAEVNEIAEIYTQTVKPQRYETTIKEAANITKIKVPVVKKQRKTKSVQNLLSDKSYLESETKKLAGRAYRNIDKLRGALTITQKYAATLVPEVIIATKVAALNEFNEVSKTVHELLKVANVTTKLARADKYLLNKVTEIIKLEQNIAYTVDTIKQASVCLEKINEELKKRADWLDKTVAPILKSPIVQNPLSELSTPINLPERIVSDSLGGKNLTLPSRYMQYGIMTPAHQKRLEAVQVKSTINDMLVNDDIISQHDPEQVIATYNELIRTAPAAMMRPMVARSFMREALAKGNILGSYDLNPLMTYEKDLAKFNNKTNNESKRS